MKLTLRNLAILGLLASGLSQPTLQAQDGDSQQGKRWYLDVNYSKLAPLVMRSPTGKQRVYWYTVLKITNKTGAARPLDLVARALTPEVKKSPSSRPGLYPEATAKIAKKYKK